MLGELTVAALELALGNGQLHRLANLCVRMRVCECVRACVRFVRALASARLRVHASVCAGV